MTEQRPDILFFPETKGSAKSRFEAETKLKSLLKKLSPVKWKCHWSFCDRAGRHGNLLVYRTDRVEVIDGPRFGFNGERESEGRVISIKVNISDWDWSCWVTGLYVPNASSGLVRLDHKLQWMRELKSELNEMKTDAEAVIVIGDINVAPDARDICNPKANLKKPGYTKEERDAFKELFLDDGWVDTWRHRNPLPEGSQAHDGVYTFWNTRSKARSRNAGWRIDLALINGEALEWVSDSIVCNQYYGSDHCPVGISLSRPK